MIGSAHLIPWSIAPSAKRSRLSTSPCNFQVVFLVDASGSMANVDVQSIRGSISRINAVFDAIECFGEALLGLDGVACSIAIFNEKHNFAMRNQPVSHDFGQQLRAVSAAVKPEGGGFYLDALRAFKEAVGPSGITVGVLLSDGVPSEDMRDYECVGNPNRDRVMDFMRAMRRENDSKCVLHAVGFGDFNADCLRALAFEGGGSFHDNRQLDAKTLRNTFRRLFGKITTLRGTVMAFGEQALKPLPPRQMEPVDAWEKSSLQEWKEMSMQLVTWIMLPRQKGCDKSELIPQEPSAYARLHKQPFAAGALRYAFHFFILKNQNERGLHLVTKESKFASQSSSPLEAARSFLKNHDKAQEIAKAFRAACLQCSAGTIAAKFVPAFVVKTSDPSSRNEARFSTAERFIPGEFVKMNGNDGYVNESVNPVYAQAASAFSHFSFDRADGQYMCVDVQGVGLEWTDPQLHSLDKSFGPGDLGKEGMKMFFSTHVCSKFCSKLKLRAVDAESLAFVNASKEDSSSSASSSSASGWCSDSSSGPDDDDDEEEEEEQEPGEDGDLWTQLNGMRLKALKEKAREEGIDSEKIESIDDVDSPIDFAKKLIVNQMKKKLQNASRSALTQVVQSPTEKPLVVIRAAEQAKTRLMAKAEKKKVKVPKLEKALTAATYEDAVYDFLKKHGRTHLGIVGQRIPRSQFPGVPKLSAMLKKNSTRFDLVVDMVDIKR